VGARDSSLDEHEVVAEIDGIARPGDEMIDTGAGSNLAAAVEAPRTLMLPQERGEAGERASLTPEQKRSHIRIREQPQILSDLEDPPHPRAADRSVQH
jgi:hypothetical protein